MSSGKLFSWLLLNRLQRNNHSQLQLYVKHKRQFENCAYLLEKSTDDMYHYVCYEAIKYTDRGKFPNKAGMRKN